MAPFDSFQKKLNVYYVSSTSKFDCVDKEFEDKGLGIESTSTHCDLSSIEQAARACGLPAKEGIRLGLQDKIVAFADDSTQGRSNANESIVIISGSNRFPQVVSHELGHTFEIADYYQNSVTTALGLSTSCSGDPRVECIMCSQYIPNFSCGLTLRFNCNMSVPDHIQTVAMGECTSEEEKALNDEQFLTWLLEKVKK